MVETAKSSPQKSLAVGTPIERPLCEIRLVAPELLDSGFLLGVHIFGEKIIAAVGLAAALADVLAFLHS